ncbi:MAG: RNA polymerase sigma-70 factor [Mangrovibacterium sp.]|nr:RNA polymerase sigma-70 factor [Mangrovibacterium sp.]
MGQNLEDKQAVGKLKKGDVASFDAIFRKYNKKVFYFANSYLKNREEAEDVVQEVFMNLWRHRDQINEQYIFSKYLFKITYNATCKRFRKSPSEKRYREEMLHTSMEDNSTKLDIEYYNLVEIKDLLINKLPEREKEIILLSIEEHLTSTEISQRLNISKKTVDNYLSKARTYLRKSLGENMSAFLFMVLFLS